MFVFLKKPLGLTLILCFSSVTMCKPSVSVIRVCVYVGMMRLSHPLMFIFVLTPHKIIMFGYKIFFFSTFPNSSPIIGDVQICLNTVFGCQKVFINKEIISASVFALMS